MSNDTSNDNDISLISVFTRFQRKPFPIVSFLEGRKFLELDVPSPNWFINDHHYDHSRTSAHTKIFVVSRVSQTESTAEFTSRTRAGRPRTSTRRNETERVIDALKSD
jgi:hypothetical protein